jgi:DnaJ-class molecular chaperone
MRKFEDLTYYELFEIPVNASIFEIRQAYRTALSIYGDDSDIAYAFFSKKERAEILERIEEAFATLINHHRRADYDNFLIAKGLIDPAVLTKKQTKVATPLFSAKSAEVDAVSKKVEKAVGDKNMKAIVDDICALDAVSGKDLQRMRTAAEITVEDVFEVTRISISTLEAIENDTMEDLPPTIYLKNFLKAYAELFEADPHKIIVGYLKNLDRARGRL